MPRPKAKNAPLALDRSADVSPSIARTVGLRKAGHLPQLIVNSPGSSDFERQALSDRA